jgi:hypothetical protein
VNDRRAVDVNQAQIFAVGGNLEIRVQFAAGKRAVLLGGKDNAVSARSQCCAGRERPFVELVVVVGQVHARHVDGGGSRVVDLDPVRGVAVGVDEVAVIGGKELGNAKVCGGEHCARLEPFERKAPRGLSKASS